MFLSFTQAYQVSNNSSCTSKTSCLCSNGRDGRDGRDGMSIQGPPGRDGIHGQDGRDCVECARGPKVIPDTLGYMIIMDTVRNILEKSHSDLLQFPVWKILYISKAFFPRDDNMTNISPKFHNFGLHDAIIYPYMIPALNVPWPKHIKIDISQHCMKI